MNYFFSTGAERIAVIEDLRKKDIVFPVDWEIHRTRQRQSMIFPLSTLHPTTHLYSPVITWLLKHNPDERPTALELSQSSLLPPRLEDEYFKGALKMMSKLPSRAWVDTHVSPSQNRFPSPPGGSRSTFQSEFSRRARVSL